MKAARIFVPMKLTKVVLVIGSVLLAQGLYGADKKIVFVAGPPSHGPREHEYRAGSLLLQSCLAGVPGISSIVYSNGWPKEPNAFDGAATVVLSSDGGPAHPAIQDARLEQLGVAMKKGAGLVCLHY